MTSRHSKVGAIDCAVIDEQLARAFVAKNADLKILESAFVSEEYAISLNPKDQALLQELNSALDRLIADGTRDAIVAHDLRDASGQVARYRCLTARSAREGISCRRPQGADSE